MYEIKVLSNEDFDQVAKSDDRYSYVDDTNLGFADREKGIAYVRQTGLHDLNKYLISHELEELEQDESTHEDPNGIRHKKFWSNIFESIMNPFKILAPIANILKFPFTAAAQGPTKAFQDIFSGFGGGQQQQSGQQYNQDSGVFSSFGQQQQGDSGGSYYPQSSVFTTPGTYGGQGSPLNLFSGSGSYSPGSVPSAAQGGLTPGILGGGEVPDYIKQQKFGSEGGRFVF